MPRGQRELSTNPKYVRKRIRDSGKDLHRDIGMLYGKPVEEWDFEELQRGRPRKPDGTFQGGPKPKWIDAVIMAEVRKRLQLMARDEIAAYTSAALDMFKRLMEDDSEDDNGRPVTPSTVKLQAATYILDQVAGKPTTKVELSGSVKLEQVLAEVMVNPDGEDAHPVIDGYVVEEEDDDDE